MRELLLFLPGSLVLLLGLPIPGKLPHSFEGIFVQVFRRQAGLVSLTS